MSIYGPGSFESFKLRPDNQGLTERQLQLKYQHELTQSNELMELLDEIARQRKIQEEISSEEFIQQQQQSAALSGQVEETPNTPYVPPSPDNLVFDGRVIGQYTEPADVLDGINIGIYDIVTGTITTVRENALYLYIGYNPIERYIYIYDKTRDAETILVFDYSFNVVNTIDPTDIQFSLADELTLNGKFCISRDGQSIAVATEQSGDGAIIIYNSDLSQVKATMNGVRFDTFPNYTYPNVIYPVENSKFFAYTAAGGMSVFDSNGNILHEILEDVFNPNNWVIPYDPSASTRVTFKYHNGGMYYLATDVAGDSTATLKWVFDTNDVPTIASTDEAIEAAAFVVNSVDEIDTLYYTTTGGFFLKKAIDGSTDETLYEFTPDGNFTGPGSLLYSEVGNKVYIGSFDNSVLIYDTINETATLTPYIDNLHSYNDDFGLNYPLEAFYTI